MPRKHPNPPIEVHATRKLPLGMPPARFLRDYWQKRPLLVRGAFPDFTPPLQPDDLAGLACMDGSLARIVLHKQEAKALDSGFRAARGPGMTSKKNPLSSRPGSGRGPIPGLGKWEVRTGPFNDDTFANLPESCWTLLVQDVDKWDPDTAALLDPFAFIPSWRIDDAMVSYASDGGGVGAHVDQYDVFLLQGLGQRHWSIDTRRNPSTAFRGDVELKLLREFHPTREWMLDPGDMLYLPPGVPHDGVAVGECMTFSLGMRAPAASELLLDFTEHVAATFPESQRYVDPDLAPATAPGEIDPNALRRARRTVGPAAVMLDDDAFADWFGGFATRYRSAQVAEPRKRRIDHAMLAAQLPRMILRSDPWSRFAWRRKGRDARLYVSGVVLDAPVAWARALASGTRVFDGSKLAELPHAKRGITLLATLIDAGQITYKRR